MAESEKEGAEASLIENGFQVSEGRVRRHMEQFWKTEGGVRFASVETTTLAAGGLENKTFAGYALQIAEFYGPASGYKDGKFWSEPPLSFGEAMEQRKVELRGAIFYRNLEKSAMLNPSQIQRITAALKTSSLLGESELNFEIVHEEGPEDGDPFITRNIVKLASLKRRESEKQVDGEISIDLGFSSEVASILSAGDAQDSVDKARADIEEGKLVSSPMTIRGPNAVRFSISRTNGTDFQRSSVDKRDLTSLINLAQRVLEIVVEEITDQEAKLDFKQRSIGDLNDLQNESTHPDWQWTKDVK